MTRWSMVAPSLLPSAVSCLESGSGKGNRAPSETTDRRPDSFVNVSAAPSERLEDLRDGRIRELCTDPGRRRVSRRVSSAVSFDRCLPRSSRPTQTGGCL